MTIKLRKKINKWRARRNLLARYRYLLEMESIMESWITKRILDGQTGRRKELIEKQNKIKEMELLINFLKKVKI